MTKITYIPGEIANAAIDEHGNRKPVTRTHHIFDDVKNKNQAQINADVDSTFAFHQSEINALDSQNYLTYKAESGQTLAQILPAIGAVDTIYRVGQWDGTQYNATKYAEYAWDAANNEYKLLDVKEYGIDAEPTAGSHNLVESGGVYDFANRGFVYLGEASPELNPGTTNGKVFYIADKAGTYTNFNNISLALGEVAVLYKETTTWYKRTLNIASKEAWYNTGYLICFTAADVAAKTVTNAGFAVSNKISLYIAFDKANTADNVTLNINNTGAKPLYYNNVRASSTNSWRAGVVLQVYYDNYGDRYYALLAPVVLDTTGQSTIAVMTQKAVTDEFAKIVRNEVVPGYNGLQFSGNTETNDPLVVNVNNLIYKRNIGKTGDLFAPVLDAGTTFTIQHGQALIFDYIDNSLKVVNNQDGHLDYNNYVLLVKQTQQIKGSWAFYYYDSLLNKRIDSIKKGAIDTKFKAIKLMSRQGQFLKPGTLSNLPYNDRIAIRNTSLKGFDSIRITVWMTSDNVPVLSHDATINSVARNPDGTTISETITIADHTLAELNQYDYGIYYGEEYAGQTITTLSEALQLCREYCLFACVELYPTTTISDEKIEAFCNVIVNAGAVKACEIRNPRLENIEKVHTYINGANLSLTFYSSDGDSGLLTKINGLKALSTHENKITMTTIPATISDSSFLPSIRRVIKEGIPIELASVDTYAALKAAVEAGIANVIEVCYVEDPYTMLYNDFISE